MEESVHGSAQCEEHAGGGAVQLGEVQLHCGLLTGLAGGRRGNPEPARKHKTGMRLTRRHAHHVLKGFFVRTD